jgi:hypothetical protein
MVTIESKASGRQAIITQAAALALWYNLRVFFFLYKARHVIIEDHLEFARALFLCAALR